MNILLYLIINGLAVYLSSYILSGVHIRDFFAATVAALVLSIANLFIKPVLLVFTLPLNILTLGLFTLIINGLMVLFASSVVPGFSVDSIWWAILFSIVLSFVSSFFNWLKRE
ncbi:MAG: phage holin family protein [Patescibacteria group bacterium]